MPENKKAIGLRAVEIKFTNFSIIYEVEYENKYIREGVVCCAFDIKDKDLILKPTIVGPGNMTVVFTPSNVKPHFYQKVLTETIKDVDEHIRKLKNIYLIGDIVGYIK